MAVLTSITPMFPPVRRDIIHAPVRKNRAGAEAPALSIFYKLGRKLRSSRRLFGFCALVLLGRFHLGVRCLADQRRVSRKLRLYVVGEHHLSGLPAEEMGLLPLVLGVHIPQRRMRFR